MTTRLRFHVIQCSFALWSVSESIGTQQSLYKEAFRIDPGAAELLSVLRAAADLRNCSPFLYI
jgi:hypothetical protein